MWRRGVTSSDASCYPQWQTLTRPLSKELRGDGNREGSSVTGPILQSSPSISKWQKQDWLKNFLIMKPMSVSNQHQAHISNFTNNEEKENSQVWSENSRRTTSRFSSCEPTSLSNLCDHLWEGVFLVMPMLRLRLTLMLRLTLILAYTYANAVGYGLPLHGIPIPPEPCEIGNCDRPKRGVSEEVIQCVPDQQVLVNITAITKHSWLVLYDINTYIVIKPLLRK